MDGFLKRERIRRRAEFKRVYEQGARIHNRYFTLFALANQLPWARLGIAATKKLGGAVERNRTKRLIREVFRRNKAASGFDVVVVPKRELLDATLSALEAEFQQSLYRGVRRARSASGV